MDLIVRRFDELTTGELYRIMKKRVEVFVIEQKCIYQELDDKDLRAVHVWLEEDGEILAYLRVLDKGVSFEEASVGRVLSVRRRQGLGTKVLREGIRQAKEVFGADSIRIEAQTYARSMYEKIGFRQVSEEFLDEGIPHIEMLLEI